MNSIIYKSTWGMPGTLDNHLTAIAAAGYDGISLNPTRLSQTELIALPRKLNEHDLKLVSVGQCQTANDVAELIRLTVAAGGQQVVVHDGRDSMTWDEGCRFYEASLKLEQVSSLPVVHETHRTRILFTPWVTSAYLRQFPELTICADLSHWVTVCERLLDDRADDLDLAIARTRHTHLRVGHAEGPQVNDPRASEWAAEVRTHFGWWDRIARGHATRNETFAATVELGPPNYLQTLPYTNQPVANLSDIGQWMLAETRAMAARI